METCVLVVDNDGATRVLISDALEDEGYHVVSAMGAAAIKVAHDEHPAVILLDAHMPQMDGRAVSRHLRADPAIACIPIIAMSAGENLVRMSATWYDDQLPKPFELDDLYVVVERWADAP